MSEKKFKQLMLNDYAYAKCGWFFEQLADMTNKLNSRLIMEMKNDLEKMYQFYSKECTK